MSDPIVPKYFHGVDLGSYGLVTHAVRGVHDLAPAVLDRQFVPGSDLPSDTVTRRGLVEMVFSCVVAGSDHADLVAKLDALKPLMDFELGWGFFTPPDRPTQRTLARTQKGFEINLDAIPYQRRDAQFDWPLDRAGWWEDLEATTVTDPASITNSGQLPCWPVYVCTVTAALGSGLEFTLSGKTFSYGGALTLDDVLVVTPEAMTAALNGAEVMADVPDDTDWPELVTGANTVSKSSEDFTLEIAYRRRYK